MNRIVASDLHGSVIGAKSLVRAVVRHHAEELLMLGDVLGGRRLCGGVDEDAAATVLRLLSVNVTYVRGNCDSASDEKELGVVFQPYFSGEWDGIRVFGAHGHLYGNGCYPPDTDLPDVEFTGHTHRCRLARQGTTVHCNVGSLGFPRGGNPPSYAVFDSTGVTVYDTDGNALTPTVPCREV